MKMIVSALVGLFVLIAGSQYYVNSKAEDDFRQLVRSLGLSEIFVYDSVSYSLISQRLTLDKVKLVTSDGELKAEQINLIGVGGEEILPDTLKIEILGIEDSPLAFRMRLFGPLQDFAYATQINTAMYGLNRSSDYSFGYEYDEAKEELTLVASYVRPDQYETGFEHTFAGFGQFDAITLRRIAGSVRSSIRGEIGGDRSPRDLAYGFSEALGDAVRDSGLTSWDNKFDERVGIARTQIFFEDDGFIKHLDQSDSSQLIAFPDENIESQAGDKQVDKFMDRVIDRLRLHRLNAEQREIATDLIAKLKEFREGGHRLEVKLNPGYPVALKDFGRKPNGPVDAMVIYNIDVSVN